jgi:hypothetical protein
MAAVTIQALESPTGPYTAQNETDPDPSRLEIGDGGVDVAGDGVCQYEPMSFPGFGFKAQQRRFRVLDDVAKSHHGIPIETAPIAPRSTV